MIEFPLLDPQGYGCGVVSVAEEMMERLTPGLFEITYLWNSSEQELVCFQIIVTPSMPGRLDNGINGAPEGGS